MTSTASDSASAAFSENCIVCGGTRSKRCSACASNGCEWMYFCSIEHQRLIWPAHKRVCGIEAVPFHWPLFTKSEAAEAKSSLSSRPSPEEPGSISFTGLISSDGRSFVTDEQLVAEVDKATQGSSLLVTDLELRYIKAAFLRRQSFRLKLSEQTSSTTQTFDNIPMMMAVIAQDPFGALAKFVRDYNSLFPLEFVKGPHGLIDSLLHKTLAHFALLAAYYKDPSTLSDLRPLLEHTKAEVLRYCREELVVSKPAVAEWFQQDLVHSFTRDTFLPLGAATDQQTVWKP
ncbi:hypothetical protein JCM16303_005921 [Sporobolomyces ruberrimus]